MKTNWYYFFSSLFKGRGVPCTDRTYNYNCFSMQKMNLTSNATSTQVIVAGKPTVPVTRQPLIERKISDPSSSFPRGEHYPIPSFFEYRIKPKEYDPL
jgi:hypothetical protein